MLVENSTQRIVQIINNNWLITEITVLEGDTAEPGQHLISIDEKTN